MAVSVLANPGVIDQAEQELELPPVQPRDDRVPVAAGGGTTRSEVEQGTVGSGGHGAAEAVEHLLAQGLREAALGELGDAASQLLVAGREKLLGHPHGLGAHPLVRVAKRVGQQLGAHLAQPLEGPERVSTTLGRGLPIADDGLEVGAEEVLPHALLDDDALRRQAGPAVGGVEGRHELGPAPLAHVDPAAVGRLLAADAPDAPEVVGLDETALLGLGAQEGGQEQAVLDEAAGEVRHVERAVRPVRQRDRPEALVGRGEQLEPGVGAHGLELHGVLRLQREA